MFKNAEKISKALDLLIKVAEEVDNPERQAQLLEVIHDVSAVHQSVLGDLRKPAEVREVSGRIRNLSAN